jgi:hypothetical protein
MILYLHISAGKYQKQITSQKHNNYFKEPKGYKKESGFCAWYKTHLKFHFEAPTTHE